MYIDNDQTCQDGPGNNTQTESCSPERPCRRWEARTAWCWRCWQVWRGYSDSWGSAHEVPCYWWRQWWPWWLPLIEHLMAFHANSPHLQCLQVQIISDFEWWFYILSTLLVKSKQYRPNGLTYQIKKKLFSVSHIRAIYSRKDLYILEE